jgi:hypothetical protein
MAYTADHASALTDVASAGAAVTFTLVTRTQTASGTFGTATSSTVTGYATEDGGDPIEYARLNLAQSEAPRLFFVPTTLGDVPPLGSTVSWGGATYTVRSSKPYRPDGVALFSYVIVAR